MPPPSLASRLRAAFQPACLAAVLLALGIAFLLRVAGASHSESQAFTLLAFLAIPAGGLAAQHALDLLTIKTPDVTAGP